MKRKRLSLKKEKSIHRSIYRYTKVNSLSYNCNLNHNIPWLLIHSFCFCISSTFNHHLISVASHLYFAYISSCVSLNKSVLNWTQVCQLLRYFKLRPNCMKLTLFATLILVGWALSFAPQILCMTMRNTLAYHIIVSDGMVKSFIVWVPTFFQIWISTHFNWITLRPWLAQMWTSFSTLEVGVLLHCSLPHSLAKRYNLFSPKRQNPLQRRNKLTKCCFLGWSTS